jgi:hypothetical protein
MKTYLILLGLLLSQRLIAQQQKPTAGRYDERIFFYPDEPSPLTLIKGELLIFPNPASAATNLSVKNMTEQAVGRGYTLQVHATDGRLCHQESWSAGQALDVSGLAEGTYLVSVRRDNLLFSQKLVVKRK